MEDERETVRVLSRFKSETGEEMSSILDLPLDVTVDKLQLICNALLQQVSLKHVNVMGYFMFDAL
jgi:ribosome assembly protein 4